MKPLFRAGDSSGFTAQHAILCQSTIVHVIIAHIEVPVGIQVDGLVYH